MSTKDNDNNAFTFKEPDFDASFAAQPTASEIPYVEPAVNTGFNSSVPSDNSVLAKLAGISSVTATGNTSSGNTADVLKVFASVQQRNANVPNALKVKLLPIEDARVYISSIAMCVIQNGIIYYTTFLLEKISRPLPNRIVQGPGGMNIEIDMTTIQYWDSWMQNIVEQTILSIEGNPKLQICHCASIVIPKLVDLTNADQLAPFYDHGSAALLANTRANLNMPSSPITVELLGDKSLSLVAKYDITPGGVYKATTGSPVIADFNVVLYARAAGKNPDRQSVHGGYEDFGITGLMGYIDFMRRQPNPTYNQMPVAGMMRPTPGYDPVLVITQNSCLGYGSFSNDSVLSQLLALPMLLPLIEPSQNKWATIFEPFANDNNSKTSIGVLGLEHNPYPGMPFKPEVLNVVSGNDPLISTDKFTAQQVVQMYCNPIMIVALDILQGGPLDWVQGLLARATPGSAAEASIVAELDAFSNGVFSKIWRPLNEPIMAANSTDIHAGYYVDGEGKMRDIRTIDYLSMLENTGGDLSIFDPFAAGFLPGTSSDVMMDQKRKMLIKLAPNFVRTGMYTRIFFNNNFINCIDQMLHTCGLHILVEGLVDMAAAGMHRQSFNSDYFIPVQTHGTFNYNVRQQPQQMGGQSRYGLGGGLAGSSFRR